MMMKSVILVLSSMYPAFQFVAAQSSSLAKTIDTTHHEVIAVLRVDSSGRAFVAGSGVLIHPRVVLTAGHVNYDDASRAPGGARAKGLVSNGSNALAEHRRIEFDWLEDVESHPETELFLTSLADTPEASDKYAFIDVGLIFLPQPLTSAPVARLPAPDKLSGTIPEKALVGVGYGYHEVPKNFSDELVDGFRRQWRPESPRLVNDLWLRAGCDSVTTLPFISAHDSGAPLFLGERVVVGVWSIIDVAPPPCPYLSCAVRVDSPEVLEWIRERIRMRIGIELN
jgi:hypothetical protein